MTTPTYCTSCGHELGIGRFCTNCGQPVPGRHPEAAPASGAPVTAVVPPPTGQLPPAARYPLFADGAPPPAPPAPPAAPPTAAVPVPPPSYAPPVTPAPAPGRSRSWVPWVIAVVVVALVAGIGAFLVVSAGGDDSPSTQDRANDGGAPPATKPTEPTTGAPVEPDSTGTGSPVEPPAPGDVVDLTAGASAQVPATAPGSRDRDNHPVTFEARNMLDGQPRTSWRMAGDGTGATLTFDLGREVVLTEVGIINGYAKVDGADNWYRGNRRIRAVQWELDDGTRITQDLTDRRTVQLIPVGPVTTTRVVLHLVTVTPPGKGPNGRDFTAISEVRFRGAPA
ncbi:NADase-type glycan-binding domain-containing protein [Pimelobacter simplex]|uniref:NADase-type glycan-binding domain-containing protein n=1 Tax=Nocardioides simplex TaxID=2045 RepID=UPI003AAEC13F